MTTIVMLHGAFRGGWAWSRVVPLLEAAGHRAIAPDLLGAGDRYDPDAPPASLSDHLDDLQAVFDAHDLRGVVLVGHSQGGFIARAVTPRVADRLVLVAYLDAPVPRHGESARDLLPLPPGSVLPDIPRDTVLPPPPLAAGSGVSADDAAWIGERLTPQGVALSLDPVHLVDPDALALPERYAFCAHTPETYPSATTRARLDREGRAYDLLDAGHDAPVTAPALVADWLLGIVADVDGGVARS